MGKGKAKAAVKNVTKKATTAVKKTTTTVKAATKHPIDVLKKAATQVKKGAVKVAGAAKDAAQWAVLVPFKPAMVKALQNKGIAVSPKASLKTIASLFFVNIVSKNNKTSKLEEHVDADKAEDAAFAAAKIAATATGVPPQTVDIVHAILDFLKGLGKKKAQEDGKQTAPLTDKEAELLAASNESTPEVEKTAPLTEDQKIIAVEVEKTSDALTKTIPGTTDSDGKQPLPAKKKHRPILSLMGLRH